MWMLFACSFVCFVSVVVSLCDFVVVLLFHLSDAMEHILLGFMSLAVGALGAERPRESRSFATAQLFLGESVFHRLSCRFDNYVLDAKWFSADLEQVPKKQTVDKKAFNTSYLSDNSACPDFIVEHLSNDFARSDFYC